MYVCQVGVLKKTLKGEKMKATLTFPAREMAKSFTSFWARKTLTGHTMSATKGDGSVEVTVYDVTEEKKTLINNYVTSISA